MRCRSLLVFWSSLLAASLSPWLMLQASAQSPGAPSVESIEGALTPRRTRGGAAENTASYGVVERIRNVRRTRGPSFRELDELYEATATMPQKDLEINFDFNSDTISSAATPVLKNLGTALASGSIKGVSILIGGHTDRKGRADYNQSLSERRAQAIARYLVEQHGIDRARLETVGYGFRKLKLPKQPFADANRRVQIVNITP